MDNFRTFYLEAHAPGLTRQRRSSEETGEIKAFAANNTLEDTQKKFGFPTLTALSQFLLSKRNFSFNPNLRSWQRRSSKELGEIEAYAANNTLEDTQLKFGFPTKRALYAFLRKHKFKYNIRYKFTEDDIAKIRKFAFGKPSSDILDYVNNSMHRELPVPPNITLALLTALLFRHKIKYNMDQRPLVTMNTPPADSKEYSNYTGKIGNRYKEFQSLISHFRKMSRTDKCFHIASFPYEYAFEREFINQLKRSVTVWVLENKTRKYRVAQGLKFLEAHKDCRVMLPLNDDPQDTGSRSFAPGRNFTEDIGNYDWASLAGGRERRAVSLRQNSLHVIDLDYTTVYDPIKNTDIDTMWNKYLRPGGVMIVAYAFKTQGASSLKKILNELEPDLTDDEYDKMSAEYSLKYLKSKQENSKTYYSLPTNSGLKGSEKIQRGVTNMANNIAQHIVDTIGTEPAFANVYRGGENTAKSTLMIRLAFVKGKN